MLLERFVNFAERFGDSSSGNAFLPTPLSRSAIHTMEIRIYNYKCYSIPFKTKSLLTALIQLVCASSDNLPKLFNSFAETGIFLI